MLRQELSVVIGGEVLESTRVNALAELAMHEVTPPTYYSADALGGAAQEFPGASTGSGQTNGNGRPTTGGSGTTNKPTPK